ncbi:hypothetical protein GGX14DRAFT_698465 [Mycena pura]|uniref:Uncharacterized protein n=1 Tax=Mycena pura TaxID=153505 RepID=A0AAD6VCE8_9AGAR|nr:hypothetical protein GGX14DRAFT_698465 [Mycena pura]
MSHVDSLSFPPIVLPKTLLVPSHREPVFHPSSFLSTHALPRGSAVQTHGSVAHCHLRVKGGMPSLIWIPSSLTAVQKPDAYSRFVHGVLSSSLSVTHTRLGASWILTRSSGCGQRYSPAAAARDVPAPDVARRTRYLRWPMRRPYNGLEI